MVELQQEQRVFATLGVCLTGELASTQSSGNHGQAGEVLLWRLKPRVPGEATFGLRPENEVLVPQRSRCPCPGSVGVHAQAWGQDRAASWRDWESPGGNSEGGGGQECGSGTLGLRALVSLLSDALRVGGEPLEGFMQVSGLLHMLQGHPMD